MKTKNDTQPRGPSWHLRLVRCCWILGFKNGIRYWTLMRKAAKNPEIVPIWCEIWLKGAEEEDLKGNHLAAGMLRAFVKETRELNLSAND